MGAKKCKNETKINNTDPQIQDMGAKNDTKYAHQDYIYLIKNAIIYKYNLKQLFSNLI